MMAWSDPAVSGAFQQTTRCFSAMSATIFRFPSGCVVPGLTMIEGDLFKIRIGEPIDQKVGKTPI
jgi:hypothetical protein